jgi:hypothetical protein
MAGVFTVACPKCKKVMQVPEVLAGKRIRCRGCNATLSVPKAATKPAAATAKASEHHDEWGPATAYGMTKEDDKPRCPFCANDIEEGQAVCLTCGYNLLTRERSATLVLHPHSGMDYFLWLLPGILCAILLLASVAMIVILWTGTPSLGATMQEWFQDWRWGRVYASIFFGFIIWWTGRFSVKRLIKHPHPPEVEKHSHEENEGDEDED